MIAAVVQFVLAAMVVAVAGSSLTRNADRLAELTGLGRLLIGSVLLAAATSLPEISVDVSAAARGLDDIAVGDLVGSSLANLLILGVADLVHTAPGRMLSRAAAAHALSGVMSMLLAAIAGIFILTRTRAGVLGIGVGSVAAFVAYVLGVRVAFFDQRYVQAQAPQRAHPTAPGGRRDLGIRGASVRFALAAALILVAAPFVADAAGRIAEASGLGGTFVGTTLVAFSTSLPELVATVASVRLGAFDLAVGNIFGSNALNMAMLLPVDVVSSGPLLGSVSTTHAVTAFWVVIITAVAVIGQLYHAEKRRKFIEPDAVAVIALVCAALATAYVLR